MTDLELALTHPHYRPLPGHCVIQFDDPPTMSGLLHIPATASHGPQLINQDKGWVGRVLHMTRKGIYLKGFGEEDFEVGDRVVFMLGAGDLGKRVIQTLNTRVYAVILPEYRISGGLPPIGPISGPGVHS